MASFDNATFKVESTDTDWYPNVTMDTDGTNKLQVDALFATKTEANKMYKKLSIVTWKRPLGTLAVIGHVEAGYGRGTLTVPIRGGTTKNYGAVLVQMDNIHSYGKYSQAEATRAQLTFVILSDPTG